MKGLDKKRIVELRGKAQSLSPTVFIGKDGLTEAVVEELIRQLRKNKLVKAKLQQSISKDRMSIAEQLRRRSGAILVEVRGGTMVFAEERPRQGIDHDLNIDDVIASSIRSGHRCLTPNSSGKTRF